MANAKPGMADLIAADQALHNAYMECIDILARMPYAEYLKTEHWKVYRNEALERAGNRCQLCNSAGLLHVHHNTYERRGQELPRDLIALCANCHAKFHDKLPAPPQTLDALPVSMYSPRDSRSRVLFNAVMIHIFGLETATSGRRIGAICSALKEVNKPATDEQIAADVPLFAAHYRSKYPNVRLPLNKAKLVMHWVAWKVGLNG